MSSNAGLWSSYFKDVISKRFHRESGAFSKHILSVETSGKGNNTTHVIVMYIYVYMYMYMSMYVYFTP